MTKTQKKRTNPFFEFLAKYRAEHPNETGPKLAKNAGIAYRAAKKKGKLGHRQHGGSCDEGDTDCSQSGFELLKGGRRKKSKKNRRAGMRGGSTDAEGPDVSAETEPPAETGSADDDMSAETGSAETETEPSAETETEPSAETETEPSAETETVTDPFTGGRRSRKNRKRAKKSAKKSAKKGAKKGAKKSAKKSKKNRKKGGRH